MIPLHHLAGRHQGARGALVAPGPSLNDLRDPTRTLLDYDVVVGISEVIFGVSRLDYLTCFDPKAARKTRTKWWVGLPIVLKERPSKRVAGMPDVSGHQGPLYYPANSLSRAEAGSLGLALGMCKLLGIAQLDLFGVDLCQREPDKKYADKVLKNHVGEIYPGAGLELQDGLWVNGEFRVYARRIEECVGEWEGMDVRNRSATSILEAFPKDPLVDADRGP